MSQLTYERMRDALEQLNMPRALEQVDALLDRAGNSDLTTVELLDQLLGAELSARRERSIVMRLKLAGLPGVKTIEQFDFGFQPSLDEAKFATCTRCVSLAKATMPSSWDRRVAVKPI